MRALLLRSVGSTLLLLGCTETPATGSDAGPPADDTATAVDAGIDTGAEDTGADAPTPMDRVDVGVPVDRPTTPDVGMTTPDVGSATPDAGTDTGRCVAGETLCGAACVTLTTDATNCGACGTVCPTGRFCTAGACSGEQRSCPAGGERGCGLVEITGGTFAMGDATLPDYTFASPVQPRITVSDFAVDAYEVTVARFRRYWVAGHPEPPSLIEYPGEEDDWHRSTTDVVYEPVPAQGADNGCTWSRATMGEEFFPLNCMVLATAQAFCAWDGGRLPTEAEWEYLAKARPIEGLPTPRRFPWGNQETGVQCRVAQFGIPCPGEPGTIHAFRFVGSYPAIGGLYDLAGNVAEMTASLFVEYSVPGIWGGVPRVDPFARAPSISSGRVVYRGGGYRQTDLNRMNSSARARLAGDQEGDIIGFRCVRSRRRP